MENTATGSQATASNAHVVRIQTLTIDSIVGDDEPTNNVLASMDVLTDSTPTVSGSISVALGAGEEIAIYTGATLIAGTVVFNGTAWSFTPNAPMTLGEHNNLRVLIQPSGGSSASAGRVISDSVGVTIGDGSIPTTTPSIVSVSDDVAVNGSITGAITSGNSIDDRVLVLTGTVDAALTTGQVVAIYDTVAGINSKIGDATATSTTTWEFTTSALSAGAHRFTAHIENSANDAQGPASAAHSVLVQELSISAVTSDDGNVLAVAGAITEDTTLTITGVASAEPGASEELVIFNGNIQIVGSVVWDGVTWEFTPDAALAVGNYSLRAKIQITADSAVTVASDAVSLTIAESVTPDHIANVVTVSDDADSDGSVTGNVADDSSTDDTTLLLTGTLDNVLATGQVVAIYDDTTKLGDAVVDGTTWSYATTALAGGSHTLSAIVESASGTQSSNAASGTSRTIIVQGVAIVSIEDNTGGTTGNLLQTGDISTDDRAPTISGRLFSALGAGEELAVYNGSTKLGVATVDTAANTWVYTPAADLAAGGYDFVVAVQPAGDMSRTDGRAVARAPSTVNIVDEVVPLTLATILGVSDDLALNGSVTGNVSDGTSTDDSQVTIDGVLDASLAEGQQVVVYSNVTGGDLVEVGVAAVEGLTWTLTTSVGVATHQFTARVEESATDRIGASSDTYNINVGHASTISVFEDFGDSQGEVVLRSGRYVAVLEYNAPGIFNQLGRDSYQEIEVWAYVNGELTNVALNKEIVFAYRNDGINAVDGDLTTETTTGSAASQGIEIDLGAEYQIVRITVHGGHPVESTQRVVSFSTSPYTEGAEYPFGVSSHPAFQSPNRIDSFGDVSGTNTYDFLSLSGTGDNTPTLSGTMGSSLGSGEVLAVYAKINGVTSRLGTTTLEADGSWSFTPTQTLVDGEYLLWAQIEDSNTGEARVVTADRVLSINSSFVTAEVSSIEISDDAISGSSLLQTIPERGSSTGNVGSGTSTDDRSPTLSGTLSQLLGTGEVVSVYDGDDILGQALVDGTSWIFQVPEARPLTDGQHALRAVVESNNGSRGSVDQTIEIFVHQSLEIAIEAIAEQDLARYVGVYFETASRYSLSELEIFSNGEKQAYEIFQHNENSDRDGVEQAYSGRIRAIQDGSLDTQWLSSSTWFHYNAIPKGAFFLLDLGELTQIDSINLLGFYSEAEASPRILTFSDNPYGRLRTSIEAAEAIAVSSFSVNSAADSTNDYTLGNQYITTQTPMLSGTLQAALGTNESLAIYANGLEIGKATVNADLTWSFSAPTLTAGVHSLVVQIQDTTGGNFDNGRVVSQAKEIIVAAEPDQTVLIDSVGDNQADAGSTTGLAADGAIIDDTTPIISGTLNSALASGQVVAVYEDSIRLGEASVDGLNWSFEVPARANLTTGVHTLTAQAENPVTASIGSDFAGTITFTAQQIDITGFTDDAAGAATGNLINVTGDSAQYVRVELDGINADTGLSSRTVLDISEIEVWAWVGGELVNVAAGLTATSGYIAADETSTAGVTDGDIISNYASALSATDNYLLIDLGSEVVIDYITIVPNYNDAMTYLADTIVSTLDANEALVSSTRIANASVTDNIVVSVNDNFVSDDTTPVISGTLAVALTGSQVVAIYDNGVFLGNAIDTGVTWTYDAALSVGNHSLEARIVDTGRVIASSANSTGEIRFAIDTAAPEQTVAITAVTDDLADNSVTGDVSGGTSSDDASIDLTGTVSGELTGAQVLAIYDGSTRIGEATVAADNSWSFEATDLVAGLHNFNAQVENAATGTGGNASNAITVITQSVNITSVVDASSGAAVNLLNSSNNAESAQYVRIENGQVGEVEVWAWVDGVLTNVAANKTVTSSLVSTTADHAIDDDVASNSDAEGWLQIDLGDRFLIDSIVVHPRTTDGTYASAPVDTLVATSHSDLSALVSVELVTNANVVTQALTSSIGEPAVAVWTRSYQSADSTPTISGTLGAALGTNEVVAIYADTTRLGTADTTGTNWTFSAGELAAGEYQIRAQVEDTVSGSASTGRASSEAHTLVVDGAAPNVSLGDIVATDDYGLEIGVVAPGGITDDRQLTLSGGLNSVLTNNQRVSVFDGTTFLGYAAAEGAQWSLEVQSGLSFGSHSVTALVENIATGARSSATDALAFTVQGVSITAITDDSGFVQGNLLNQDYADGGLNVVGRTLTDDQNLTISGQIGSPLAESQVLRLYDGGVSLGNATVNADLTWSIDIPNLSYASHELSVQIEDSSNAGESIISQSVDISVLTSDPLSALTDGTTLYIGGRDRSVDLSLVDDINQPPINATDLSDIQNSGSNQITLEIEDVLNAGTNLFRAENGYGDLVSDDIHQIRIDGDSGDTVNLADDGWIMSDRVTSTSLANSAVAALFGETYDVYVNSNDATVQLLIDSDLTVI